VVLKRNRVLLKPIAEGLKSFTDNCAGCHGVLARGGVVTGAVAPSLMSATSRQIVEALRVGPYLMPRFTQRQIDDTTAADIAAYVQSAEHPDDRGGWGIGHLGPVPEGMIAWFVGAVALLVIARLAVVGAALGIDLRFDWHVLAWMFGACLFTALVFGVAPAPA
jgi:hypothetical protein